MGVPVDVCPVLCLSSLQQNVPAHIYVPDTSGHWCVSWPWLLTWSSVPSVAAALGLPRCKHHAHAPLQHYQSKAVSEVRTQDFSHASAAKETTVLPGYNAVVFMAGLSCSLCLWMRFWEKYGCCCCKPHTAGGFPTQINQSWRAIQQGGFLGNPRALYLQWKQKGCLLGKARKASLSFLVMRWSPLLPCTFNDRQGLLISFKVTNHYIYLANATKEMDWAFPNLRERE